MIYELTFMGGDKIEITEDNANNLIGKTGLIAITGIGIINLNSVMSILPKGLAKGKDDNTKTLHDGSKAVKKFGVWKDEYSGSTLDLGHYPELLKKDTKGIESPSKYAKQLCK